MATPVIIACSSCGAKNRVPPERFKDRPVCGKCRERLVPGGASFDVEDGDFRSAVLKAPLPVVVDFWAPWCGPCKVVAPILEEIALEQRGRALVARCNVDRNPGAASRFGVQGIPTLVLFHRGLEVDRLVGAVPKGAIEGMIERAAGP